jgi:hypothetical protein
MEYDPLIPGPARGSLGLAIAVGAAVAVACAFVVGLIGGATNTQFAYGAVLIGWLAGLSMRKIRVGTETAIAGAAVALIGSALSSVISLTLRIVKVAHVPLSLVLAHESTVISDVPHYIGFFGFLCWAIAAYVGWATAAGRRRRRGYGRMRGAAAVAGQAPPYGTPPGQAPYATGPGPYQGQPNWGQPNQDQPNWGQPNQGQPNWGSADPQTGQSGYGFTGPSGQGPDAGSDQPPGT